MSARQFSKVSPAVWRSKRFTDLADPWAQLLYVYFLTCEHQNSAGCFRLPDGYASADLGWPVDAYQAARSMLVNAGLITFDAETSEIYVDRWFKHNPAMGDKHATGAGRLIGRIESDALREKVEAEFMLAEDIRTAKVVSIGGGYGNPGIANSRLMKR